MNRYRAVCTLDEISNTNGFAPQTNFIVEHASFREAYRFIRWRLRLLDHCAEIKNGMIRWRIDRLSDNCLRASDATYTISMSYTHQEKPKANLRVSRWLSNWVNTYNNYSGLKVYYMETLHEEEK